MRQGRSMAAMGFAALAAGAALVVSAAGSATSPSGVIDSRLSASGGASAAWLEARSGETVGFSSDETSAIDTATPIGSLILFR